MSEHDSTETGSIGNSPIPRPHFSTIEAFVRELVEVNAQHARLHVSDAGDAAIEPVYQRHWAIREAINSTPSCSLSELRAKARAVRIAAELDEDFACHVPGSTCLR